MAFPQRRLRRLRRTPALRRLVAETRLSVDDLVAPLFVREGITEPQPIASLPGVVQHTRESLRKEVAELAGLGVPAVDPLRRARHQGRRGLGRLGSRGHRAARPGRPPRRGRRRDRAHRRPLRRRVHRPRALRDRRRRRRRSTTTPPSRLYERAAVAQADAGADIMAPSGMMDGQVAAIRAALDGAGHTRHRDPRLRGQVRLGPLRTVPRRRRRHHRRRRRPQGLPAGPAQRPRGAGGDPRRRRRGRRPRHGEAGPRLPRRDRRRPGRGRPARRGLPRVRRVLDDQGRRRAGLDRRRRRRPRAPHRHQAGRRRPHPHLPRPRDRRACSAE